MRMAAIVPTAGRHTRAVERGLVAFEAENVGFQECLGPLLVGLDAGSLDNGPPLLDLGPMVGEQSLRRMLVLGRDILAKLRDALPHHGISKGIGNRGIELTDDLPRRA